MRVYKLLLVFLTSLALAGCGSKTWDWFFDDDEEEVAYEEEEVMVDEEFEDEEEYEEEYADDRRKRRSRDDDEYEYEEEEEYDYEEEYDEYEDDEREPSRGRGMSRYGDEPEYQEDRGRERPAARTPGRTVIYFDYKKNIVPANGLNLLQLHAQFLRANPNVVVTVEGHTDSVAPADYNKRLGMVRAQAVADVLTNMGVSPSQIVTVSYGEERPAQAGDDESVHAMNRRVELAY